MLISAPMFFYFFAGLALMSACFVVLKKNPVSSALSLVMVFFSLAVIYALMGAHLMAAMQILVYTGAVMVLFVFVIMLLNADVPYFDIERSSLLFKGLVFILFFVMNFILISAFVKSDFGQNLGVFSPEAILTAGGNTRVIARLMFSEFILPFELVGILLLACIIGVVIIAMRKVENKEGGKSV